MGAYLLSYTFHTWSNPIYASQPISFKNTWSKIPFWAFFRMMFFVKTFRRYCVTPVIWFKHTDFVLIKWYFSCMVCVRKLRSSNSWFWNSVVCYNFNSSTSDLELHFWIQITQKYIVVVIQILIQSFLRLIKNLWLSSMC